MPVITNMMGSMEMIKLALQVDDLDDIGKEIMTFLNPPELPSSFLDKLKTLPKLAQISSFLPKNVRSGPCKEVIIKDKPSLAVLPVLKCWPMDGGPIITCR